MVTTWTDARRQPAEASSFGIRLEVFLEKRKGRQILLLTESVTVAGDDREESGRCDEQEERAQKADVILRLFQAHLFDLLRNEPDDDFQKVLPAGPRQIHGQAPRDELRSVERTAAEMGMADLLAEVLDEPDEIGA